MRAVVQRVLQAQVEVDKEVVGQIGPGLLVYLGVEKGDTNDDLVWVAEKVLKMRIFPDQEEKMQFPITEVVGSILLISQFTLCADLRKGNRPSFAPAAQPEEANGMYEAFVGYIAEKEVQVQTGVFGAMMQVSSLNDGPVTLVLDSKNS
jgi:D-aminoacyl-tRNA deacylase